MNRILKSNYSLLAFSLVSGVGYFLLVMILISDVRYSYLLGLFFLPTIVCGAALCLYKTIKTWLECEEYSRIYKLITIHFILIVFSAVFAVLKWVF